MNPKSNKLLKDVCDAAEFVLYVVQDKSLEDYHNDRLLRQAIERNFEVIGEALGRLRKIEPELASRIPEAPQIVAFRNLLIHGYDTIDVSLVWQVIENDLPKLKDDVTALLTELP